MEEEVKLEGKTARFFKRLSKKKYTEEEIVKAEGEADSKYKSRLGDIWSRVQVLFQIARHPSIWGPQLAVLATLAVIYLVSPIDAVPDAIPALGLTDDIAVITAVIAALVKSVSAFSSDKIASIRNTIPEKLLATFDAMFTSKDGTKTSFLNEAKRMAEEAARAAVTAALEKMVIKSLIRGGVSLVCLFVAALFYGLSSYSWILLIPSSIFLLASYVFFAMTIVKFARASWLFYKGWKVNHSVEDGVVNVVQAQLDDGLKKKLVTAGVRAGVRLPSSMKLSLLKFFRKDLLVYLAQIVLISLSFVLLKHFVFMTVAGQGFFASLFLPLYDLVGLVVG